MPYSLTMFDQANIHWIKTNFSKGAKILDVGPGVGKFGRLLKPHGYSLDAVEVFAPYMRKYELDKVYGKVVVCDVRDYAAQIEKYDLVIWGDVLEHLPVDDAQALLRRCKRVLVQVPFEYVQGELEGNPAEAHVQDDLTPAIIRERYPGLVELFPPRLQLGVYVKTCDKPPDYTHEYRVDKIGLVVHAIKVPKERDRLLASLDRLGSVMRHVEVCVIDENSYPEYDLVKLNVSAAKNIGLRTLLPRCAGVVCIDADYIIPPGLFELLLEPALQKFHVWIRRRDIVEKDALLYAWQDWIALGVFNDCWGSCNYMSSANWYKVGGWDERTEGWGGDDDILHIRVGQYGIERRRIDGFPLVHVKHELRPWVKEGYNGKQNIRYAHLDQPNFLEGCLDVRE